MRGLKGRVACVTGAAQGIGQEICARLAEEGAQVAVMDIRDTTKTVECCTQFGVEAQGFLLDVRDKQQIHAVV